LQIDHDPDEPPRDRSWKGIPWLATFMVAILWIGNLALFDLDWHSVTLGALTGGAFVAIILDYTGNRVPKWMRR
jgi:hypothetical protein